MSEFISKYISTCAEKGINSPADIARSAEDRIKDIDKLLMQADIARAERGNLQEVIRSFGFDPPKQVKKRKTIINDEFSKDDLDPRSYEIARGICEYIAKNNEPSKLSLIMSSIGNVRADYEVYEVIKWLTITGIISRQEDRSLIKGLCWEDRPMKKEETSN